MKPLAKPAKPSVVQSPFLLGTNIQFAWDSTSLGYFKTCPRLYYYQMIEGWTGKDESIHLRFGIEYHLALQDYDDAKAEGKNHAEATHYAVERALLRTYGWDVDITEKPGDAKNRKSLIMAVVWYLEKYRVDAAETVILDSGKPATELSFKFELDWGPQMGQPYLLCGHLDRVVKYSDELFVMDRKTTTSTLGSYYFSQFHPNNQMSLYSFASQVVLDSPIKGVMIDACQLVPAGVKVDARVEFQRGITYRTPAMLTEWLSDLRVTFAYAEQCATSGYWPQNDTACDKFGGCKFRKICSSDPGVRPQFLKTKFIKQSVEERWNPLKPR